jgi:hypothetical protein
MTTLLDKGIASQMEKILQILQTIPAESQLYADVQPTFNSVEARIKATKGVL